MNDQPDRERVVFNDARRLPAGERAAYLDNACGGNAALRQRVEELLQANEDAGAFLESPAPGAGQFSSAEFHFRSDETTRLAAVPLEKAGDRIGRYKLLQQIGEGGCGVVYMSEQQEPVRRQVALKVIKLGMETKNVIARFEAERQALAMMDHPNIAKVLDAGATETGRPYFVMELVRGIKITEYCDQQNLPTRGRLDLFIQVCQAVQHAHQKGIIHRDIKPSNILVTSHDGLPVPKVIDFGIAKATTDQRLTDKTLFTAFQQFIGTPAYMSPEQAEMSELGIDTRSDIYSLGVLLYELLTGRTPFDQTKLLAAGLDEMRRTIREKEPPKPSTRLGTMLNADLTTVAQHHQSEPSKLMHLVRGDLDWIVMKSLEKDRTRRYETANGLAMDIQHHLNSEPVVARPPSRLYEFQKTVQRHWVGFAATAAVIAALIIGLGVSSYLFVKERQAQRQEASLRRQAQATELIERQQAYGSDMNLAAVSLGQDMVFQVKALLNRNRPQPGEPDLRGFEWRYLWQFCIPPPTDLLCQRSNKITSLSFSRDSMLLAIGTQDGELTIWDVAGRRIIFRAESSDAYPCRAAFSPQTNLLAYSDSTNVVLWDSRSHFEIRRLPLNAHVRDIQFTRDGRLFTASPNFTQGIMLWDANNGTIIKKFGGSAPEYQFGTIFSATDDGRYFAQAYGHHNVRVVDTASGSNLWSFAATDQTITGVGLSSSGRILAIGSAYDGGVIKLWNVETHQFIGELAGSGQWIQTLRILPDGKTLVSSDGAVRSWDINTRLPLNGPRGYSVSAFSVAGSPDGQWLASGGWDFQVRLWKASSIMDYPPTYRILPEGSVSSWAFSPDSRLIGAVQGGKLKLYDAGTFQLVVEPALKSTNINSFGFSPDLRLLAATDRDGNLRVWDLAGQQMLTNFPAQASAGLIASGFISHGKRLLTCGKDGLVRMWNTDTWQETSHWSLSPEMARNLAAWALCPTNGLIAVGSSDPAANGEVELISADNPENRRRFACNGLAELAFSPDGTTLGVAPGVDLRDVGTLNFKGASIQAIAHSVNFSPDGQRVIVGGGGKEAVTIWNMTTREKLAGLEGKGSIFSDITFSPDGNMIGGVNLYGDLHIWRAPSWSEIAAVEKAGEW